MNLNEPESVWDYPRPPRADPVPLQLRVVISGEVIADTRRGVRVLETGHPPTYYFPPEDVRMAVLSPSPHESECPWRGTARYFHAQVRGLMVEDAAWTYPAPHGEMAAIAGYIAFYPERAEGCYVESERVRPESGGYYGGWITSNLVGIR